MWSGGKEAGLRGFYDALSESEDVYTTAEWLTLLARHGIDLEVSADGDAYITSEQSEDVYPINDRYHLMGE